MIFNRKNPHGGDIYRNNINYDFSANVSPLGTPQAVKNAVINSAKYICAYPDAQCEELVEKLSIHENVPKEFLICGNGAAELIFSFASALKPKRALIVAPTFCEYEKSLAILNCHIDYFYLNENDNFSLDEKFLIQLTNCYEAVYICNPNNPTGKAYDKNFMLKISKICHDMRIMLFIDECFCDLSDFPENYSVKQEILNNPYIFILKAFTKSYGMAGVRLGYGMCSNVILLTKMSNECQSWNVSTTAQFAGIAALDCNKFLLKNRQIISEERAYIFNSLNDLNYIVFSSSVNFILFKADIDLYPALLSRKILIRSCENFKGLHKKFYRCAVKNHQENIAFINAMEEITYEKSR